MLHKRFFVFSSICFWLSGCATDKPSEQWVNLFNGNDLTNWTVKINHHKVGENYGNTFRVEDGLLKVRYDQYEFNDEFGHLFYNTPFDNFHLRLDYRFIGEFEEGAPSYARLNSGVMFHSQSPRSINLDQNWPISVEMQFLADTGDGSRFTGSMCSPGTDVVYAQKIYPEHCLPSNFKALTKEQWVHAELIVKQNTITHMINGEVVLQYSRPTIDGKDGIVVGQSPEYKEHGKILQSGYIGLQSEGQSIEFKNIIIRRL